MALGIGANTAFFAVFYAVLLRPLPFPQPQQLVYVWSTDSSRGVKQETDSYPDFRDWRHQAAPVFSGLSAIGFHDFTLTGRGAPLHATGVSVSANLFRMLGARPALGRVFRSGEDRVGAVAGADAVILSYRLWQSKFGGDPAAVGSRVELDDRAYQIVGVMPAGFQFPLEETEDLWTTIAPIAAGNHGQPMTEQRGSHMFWVVGRLRPGIGIPQAQARMDAVARELGRQGVRIVGARRQLTGDIQPMLLILFGAVGCVLLIACVNVANLLLARGAGRRHEMAIRAALGAGRGALLRQLLGESALLGLLGGAGGLLLAAWCAGLLLNLAPAGIPRFDSLRIGALAFAFALGLGLLAGLLFGLLPALDLARGALHSTLNEGARGGEGRARRRWRAALIVAECGLALALLISAGLLIASFARLSRVNAGFEPKGLLTATVSLPEAHYSDPQIGRFYQELCDNLRRQPGVLGAAAVAPLPFAGDRLGITVDFPAHPLPDSERPVANFSVVTPQYFRTMRIPQLAGRDFGAGDDAQAPPVVVVNQAFARRFFPGRDPVGALVRPGISETGAPPPRRIVGVVGDAKLLSAREPAQPMIYLPESQIPFGSLHLVLRAAGAPEAEAGTLRAAVRALDASLPVYDMKPMAEWMAASLAQIKFEMILLSLFAALALALAAVGLYAVIAHLTAQRTREIGIRMALGAQRGDVLGLVLWQGLALALLGAAAGLALAAAASRLLAGTLYGVNEHDPWIYAAVTALLLAIAAAACWLPARRAARVDPVVALRYE